MKRKNRIGSPQPFQSWRAEKRNRRSTALVLVLWVVVMLSAIALHASFSSHLRVQVTAEHIEGTKALFLARAGIERAMAELIRTRDSARTLADLRESTEVAYTDVKLGDGSYTLFAGLDEKGEPAYGIMDEGALLNINTANAEMLSRLPGMNADLAADIVSFRERTKFNDVNDLLLVKGVDVALLFGEDANGNGLLDPTEDDGDESWPPDDADGRLDRGLAAFVTTFSAARNVSAGGKKRVNINSAGADEIAKSVSEIGSQAAESIVEHRKKKKFKSVAELLDVELVTKTSTETKDGQSSNKEKSQSGSKDDEDETSSKSGKKTSSVSTGRKAFDANSFRKIADLVAVTDEEKTVGLINVNTASRQVLACLPGMTEAIAREVVLARAKGEGGMTSVADLLDVEGLSEDRFKRMCPHVSVRSDVFRARSFGVLGEGQAYRCAEAVIDRTTPRARIRYWREIE